MRFNVELLLLALGWSPSGFPNAPGAHDAVAPTVLQHSRPHPPIRGASQLIAQKLFPRNGTTIVYSQTSSATSSQTVFIVAATSSSGPPFTAHQIITPASKVKVCPAPTNSEPVLPQATGSTALWGCAPGFLCSPPKHHDCQVWAGPPSYDYVCSARYCRHSPPTPNVVWTRENASFYPASDYFNLNPTRFGIGYNIFEPTESDVLVRRKPFRQGLVRQLPANLPAICFATCNNGYIEAQKIGKSRVLCDNESAFQLSLQSCNACIKSNSNNSSAPQPYIDIQVAPFVSFCEGLQVVEPGPLNLVLATRASTTTRSSTVRPTMAQVTLNAQAVDKSSMVSPSFVTAPPETDSAVSSLIYLTIQSATSQPSLTPPRPGPSPSTLVSVASESAQLSCSRLLLLFALVGYLFIWASECGVPDFLLHVIMYEPPSQFIPLSWLI